MSPPTPGSPSSHSGGIRNDQRSLSPGRMLLAYLVLWLVLPAVIVVLRRWGRAYRRSPTWTFAVWWQVCLTLLTWLGCGGIADSRFCDDRSATIQRRICGWSALAIVVLWSSVTFPWPLGSGVWHRITAVLWTVWWAVLGYLLAETRFPELSWQCLRTGFAALLDLLQEPVRVAVPATTSVPAPVTHETTTLETASDFSSGESGTEDPALAPETLKFPGADNQPASLRDSTPNPSEGNDLLSEFEAQWEAEGLDDEDLDAEWREALLDEDDDAVSTLIRRETPVGESVLYGTLKATFEPEQTLLSLHVPFVPAFIRPPFIEAETECPDENAPDVTVKLELITPFGARIDLQRRGSHLPAQTVLVTFEAREAATTSPPAERET